MAYSNNHQAKPDARELERMIVWYVVHLIEGESNRPEQETKMRREKKQTNKQVQRNSHTKHQYRNVHDMKVLRTDRKTNTRWRSEEAFH